MSKAGVLAIAILMICLTVLTAGSALPFGPPTVSANDPGSTGTSGTVTLRSQAGPGESAWTRLRWVFAGVAVSAVLLVARRQLLILIDCREDHGPLKVPERRSAISFVPGTESPEAFPVAFERDWFQSPAVSTVAER